MCPEDELEKYIKFGLSGSMEIKGDEKKYWLGEFRERVIFALTKGQINRKEAMKVIDLKLKDSRITRLVIRSGIGEATTGKYMDLSKKHNVEFKTIDTQSEKEEIALVLVSDDAVNEDNVLEDIPVLPKPFYNAKNNKLCSTHMQELKEKAPLFVEDFEEVSFFDKMVGIPCRACDEDEFNGVLM